MPAVTLADGRVATIRPLSSADGPALERAVARADPWDLRRRFMGSPPPASVLVAQLSRMDGVHDVALGAFDASGRLVGVAQFDRTDDQPVAEVAIEVAHDWQHDGLGIALLRCLAQLAREQGIHEFTATFYADNIAIRRLLKDVARIVSSSYESGEGYARLDLDALADDVSRDEVSGGSSAPRRG